MGMGVATMPIIEMNRYTKSAFIICTCVWKIIVRMDMQFNKCEWKLELLAVHDIVDYHVNK